MFCHIGTAKQKKTNKQNLHTAHIYTPKHMTIKFIRKLNFLKGKLSSALVSKS